MSRRFNDEPVNLIHRIPTPEQLASARPAKQPLGQAIVDTMASYVRSAVQAIFGGARVDRPLHSTGSPDSAYEDCPHELVGESPADCPVLADPGIHRQEMAAQPAKTAAVLPNREEAQAPASSSSPALVQPEEIAELRAYLLSQQQDIARLSAQIHELKSLVVSQQQVLVCLGKELESRPVSPLMQGIASAAPKRNRTVRQKPIMKDKAVARQDEPKRSPPLGLWPASTRRPDL